MKQWGEEKKGPSEMAQAERKYVRDEERRGETQEAKKQTLRDVDQEPSRDYRPRESIQRARFQGLEDRTREHGGHRRQRYRGESMGPAKACGYLLGLGKLS